MRSLLQKCCDMHPQMQGLLVVYKAQHGIRQGVISVELATASLQLEESAATGLKRHAVKDLSSAFAILSKPPRPALLFHRNAVHPGRVL